MSYIFRSGMPFLRALAPTWERDYEGRLVLMRIPQTIDLCSSDQTSTLVTDPTSLATLPVELLATILDYLDPVERVCLGLTCKRLAGFIVNSPRLTPTTWAKFVNSSYGDLLPESYQLIQRLAHGWIDKTQLRYCWKCHKILPRDEEYFRRHLKRKKKPKWSVKVDMEKDRWLGLSKRRRYQHLVRVWCEAEWEDSSCLSCDMCRAAFFAENVQKKPDAWHGPDKPTVGTTWSEASRRHPTECPRCLEAELAKPTHRTKRLLRNFCRATIEISWNIISGTGIVLFYLLAACIELPISFFGELWEEHDMDLKLRSLKFWRR